MEKKFIYKAPEVEVFEVKLEGSILHGSLTGNGQLEDVTVDQWGDL